MGRSLVTNINVHFLHELKRVEIGTSKLFLSTIPPHLPKYKETMIASKHRKADMLRCKAYGQKEKEEKRLKNKILTMRTTSR